MDNKIAHDLDENERTEDIKLKEKNPFSKMLLCDAVKKGLNRSGFQYPTIIQANAIPMGKAGIDLLCQSKSGTGKTLIFCTILLEKYDSSIREPQSLILVPTREIAVQIEEILNKLGHCLSAFRSVSVIGGLDVAADRKKLANAKSVVGTPGRVLHLIQNDMFNTSKINLLVLDEADRMMSKTFLKDFEEINRFLPRKKQFIACSATFCQDLDKQLSRYMKNPLLVSTEKRATLLVGIKQFIYEIPEEKTSILEMSAKLKAVKKIFSQISFKQCLSFSCSQSRAESYRNTLEKEGWPCEVISGAQDQKTRLEMFKKFQEFKTRILISTDLMSRGIDSENVNLVINLEPPDDGPTYLHRIGRAGRFGSHGIAITFIASTKDSTKMKNLLETIGSGMSVYKYPTESNVDLWNFSELEKEINCVEIFNRNDTNGHVFCDFEPSNKENINHIKTPPNSIYVDTNTYKIEYIERDSNANKIILTETMSSLQRLPSSNTIDDASSIAVDSDIFQSHSKGSKEVFSLKQPDSMSLLEVLIDNSKSSSTEQIDLFEDYKTFEGNKISLQKQNKPIVKNQNLVLRKLLVDSNKAAKVTKDVFSEYEKINENEDEDESQKTASISCSLNSQQEPAPGPSNKEMKLLNVKVPHIGESSEELPEILKMPHFPSPNVYPQNQFPVLQQPPYNDNNSADELSSVSSSDDVSTSSSGFDEKTTSPKSSGISTSSFEDHQYDNEESLYNEESSEESGDERSYDTSTSESYDECEELEDYVENSEEDNNEVKTYTNSGERASEIRNELKQQSQENSLNQISSEQNFLYENAYARWTDLYWNQMTQIQDYVKFCTYVNRNTNL